MAELLIIVQKYGEIIQVAISRNFDTDFCKQIFGVQKSTNTAYLYAELSRVPLVKNMVIKTGFFDVQNIAQIYIHERIFL